MKYWPRRESLKYVTTRTTHVHAGVQGPHCPRAAPWAAFLGGTVSPAPAQPQPALPVEEHIPGATASALPGRRAALPRAGTHRRAGATAWPADPRTGGVK